MAAQLRVIFILALARVHEVEDVGVVIHHQHIRVMGTVGILLADTCASHDGTCLANPVGQVIAGIHRLAVPDIGDHPVLTRQTEYVGALLALIAGGDALVLPGVQVGAIRIVGVGVVVLILVPHAPAVREGVHAGIDHPLAVQGESALIGPVPQVGGGVVQNPPDVVPVGRHTGDVADEHVIGSFVPEHLRGPEGVAAVLDGLQVQRAPVEPGLAVVRGGRHAQIRAMHPADVVAGDIGPAGSIDHPPGFLLPVVDDGGIGGAVKDGIAEKRCGSCTHGGSSFQKTERCKAASLRVVYLFLLLPRMVASGLAACFMKAEGLMPTMFLNCLEKW